jgi:hypothetical protein
MAGFGLLLQGQEIGEDLTEQILFKTGKNEVKIMPMKHFALTDAA